ncbi:MAG: response regulator [Alphaproteobacteria bacterium]|jgi:two-component system phosphate regulon response regulator OmpR|nr:response regulator [Alphaproteobacteria bacterium]MDZ4868871.1 response regulator [Alphaproteobacteria bacterium]
MSAEAELDDVETHVHHLLIVDDDTRIRTLLQRYLSENGYRVTAAKDAAEARQLMASLDFDFIVLDVMMPGEDGFALTKAIRETSRVPILLLTARGETGDRIEGLERGADDYLAKPFEPRELLLRIATILRRAGTPVEVVKQIMQLGTCRFDAERGELTRDGKPVKLTSAELQLMRVLAANPGQTFSRSDLSERMGAVLERTVDVQITRLRRKIENDPKLPLYLQTVRGVGYVLMPDRVG